MNDASNSTVKESYVLLDTSTCKPPQFLTVSGETTPHGHLAEKFPSAKVAEKVRKIWTRISNPSPLGLPKKEYTVARLTEIHIYALTWEDPKP
jgi:hypothetical protein